MIEQIDLKGTQNEAKELERAEIFFAAFYPGAKLAAHPAGAVAALKVAAVPRIGQPTALPARSAARRKFFLAAIHAATSGLEGSTGGE